MSDRETLADLLSEVLGLQLHQHLRLERRFATLERQGGSTKT